MQVLYLGRAPRTKETLPDFLKWRRVTQPPLVFRRLMGSQRTPGVWGVTDKGSEITIFKSFLLKEWENTNISIKGVTENKEKITKQKKNVEIMIHNKIVTIWKVYQYNNIECDIILGNYFLQQFLIYQQTIYTIILKTSCDHWIRIPRILKPFRINYDKKSQKMENIKNKYIYNL